tara:strand:+ start:89 stop:1621 length:1533 start_codon:yes stop_codon:yes gene_type:complete
MAASQQMQIDIKGNAKNLIKEFEKLEKRMGKLENKVKKGTTGMRGGFAGLRRTIGAARNNLLLLSFTFGTLTAAAIKSASAFAKFEQVERGFENLAGAAGMSENAFNKLKQATDGTVDSTRLMEQANQAMLLGVTDSEDEMAELFDTAQRLGQALGKDTPSSIESLITGMGRQSKLMLDNLGIVIDTNGAYEDYAKGIGKSASELTDAQKKQAFMTATMEAARNKVKQLGKEQLSTAEVFAQMKTAVSDLVVEIGEKLAPVFRGAARAITGLSNAVKGLLDWFDDEEIKKVEKFEISIAKLADAKAFDPEKVFQPVKTKETLADLDRLTKETGKSFVDQQKLLMDLEKQRLSSLGALTKATQGFSKEMGASAETQALLGIASIVINTAAGIQAAFAPPKGHPKSPTSWLAATAVGVSGATQLAAAYGAYNQMKTAEFGYSGVVDQPTMFLAGEAGAETVNVTPLEGPNVEGPMGGTGIVVNISAPLVDDTVVDTLLPAIREAVRRGEAIS